MSIDKLTEGLAKQLDRRTFLIRVGAGAIGALAALMGLPKNAAAAQYACCGLCVAYSSSCTGCYCQWSWYCCDGHHLYKCKECYRGSCSCNDQACSSAEYLGWGGVCGDRPDLQSA